MSDSFAVLSSGSTANSYIFKTGNACCVVDSGLSVREFETRSKTFGAGLRAIRFVLITHGHTDHVRGLRKLSKRLRVPVYMHPDIEMDGIHRRTDLTQSGEHSVEGITFITFPLSHDSAGATGYKLVLDTLTITLITDTGTVTPAMFTHAFDSDILMLEANYNETMLKSGPYPAFLKGRICSDHGHLSNKSALAFLNDLRLSPRLKKVYFCHLSDTNNSPEALQQDIHDHLEWAIAYTICSKGTMVLGEE